MPTFLFDKIIFGPVKSRRLGVSLGINLLPTNVKVCSFDCIYCECGRNPKKYEEKIWDHAAGWLIVKEAEGEVTDIRGKPLDFSQGRTLSQNYGVVATNGKIHSRVLSAIKKVYEAP